MTPDSARALLGSILTLAYSGELGAIRAYVGHRHALRDYAQKLEVRRILEDEIRHRRRVGEMLVTLGRAPDPYREWKMNAVGRTISLVCHLSGWFIPMWGAGRLEAQNIVEYEHAARLAKLAGLDDWVEDFLHLAEVEWDHELYFRSQAETHWLWRVFPRWKVPPPRETIRQNYALFQETGDAPRLVRHLVVR